MSNFTEEDARMLKELQARKAADDAYVDELVQFKQIPGQATTTPIQALEPVPGYTPVDPALSRFEDGSGLKPFVEASLRNKYRMEHGAVYPNTQQVARDAIAQQENK